MRRARALLFPFVDSVSNILQFPVGYFLAGIQNKEVESILLSAVVFGDLGLHAFGPHLLKSVKCSKFSMQPTSSSF